MSTTRQNRKGSRKSEPTQRDIIYDYITDLEELRSRYANLPSALADDLNGHISTAWKLFDSERGADQDHVAASKELGL